MANATDIVKKGVVRRTDEFISSMSVKTLSAATRFYRNAMMGLGVDGYLAKLDDTAPLLFAGVVRGDQGNQLLPAGTAGAEELKLAIQMPYRFELAIASVAVTDIGKPVYALDDQTGTLDYSATTYANLIGQVAEVVASGIALVEPAYDGLGAHVRLGAAKALAATGAQTIQRWDMGKTLFCANTAALTLTLPSIAATPAGMPLTVVKSHASNTDAITIQRAGTDTFLGGGTSINSQDAAGDTVTLHHNGSVWIQRNRIIA